MGNSLSKSTGEKTAAKKKRFVPPTLEEVEEYVRSRNSTVNAKTFWEYFNEGDWQDSEGKPVQNWKQKLITWEKHDTGGNRRGYNGTTAARNQGATSIPHVSGVPLD